MAALRQPAPALPEDLVEEILLRTPPKDPARLVRAALAFCPRRPDHRGWRALDSHHGCVLLYSEPLVLAVWDPVKVLCAAAAGECDHLDCHDGPFLMVVVASHFMEGISAYVYSSESDAWSEPTSTLHGQHQVSISDERGRCAHIGKTLCFMFGLYPTEKRILVYDLSTREMTTIELPRMSNDNRIVLMTAEGGGLGFAMVKGSKVYLWSWEPGPIGEMGWTQSKVIELKMLLPGGRIMITLDVVGFVDGSGVVYVGTNHGSFATNLKSGLVRNVLGVKRARQHCSIHELLYSSTGSGLYR